MASSYGLRVVNDTNAVQIDQDYRNYVLLNKITVTSVDATTAGVAFTTYGCTWVSYTTVSTKSLLAFRSDYPVAIMDATVSGTQTVYKIGVVAGYVPITIYEFGPAPASTDGYGLRVWNGSSEVVFDSNYHYMRIVDYWTCSYDPATGDLYVKQNAINAKTYSSPSTLAFCPGYPASGTDSYQSWTDEWENSMGVYCWNNTSTGFYFWEQIIYSYVSSVSLAYTNTSGFSCFIVDVTNL